MMGAGKSTVARLLAASCGFESIDCDRELEHRADDAAALQIPFIVTLNRLVEDYYSLRRALEARLR